MSSPSHSTLDHYRLPPFVPPSTYLPRPTYSSRPCQQPIIPPLATSRLSPPSSWRPRLLLESPVMPTSEHQPLSSDNVAFLHYVVTTTRQGATTLSLVWCRFCDISDGIVFYNQLMKQPAQDSCPYDGNVYIMVDSAKRGQFPRYGHK